MPPTESAEFERRMLDLYGSPRVRPVSSPLTTGLFLRSLVRMTRPKLAVELGTWRGVSSLWLGQGLRENNHGTLHTFDLFEHSSQEDVIALVGEFGLGERIVVNRAPSSTGAVSAVRELGEKIDFLFIDADHRDLVPSVELMAFWPLLAEGGIVAMHDTNPVESGWDGPRFALDLLKREGLSPQNSFVIELPTAEGGHGIALIQKKSAAAPRLVPWIAYLAYQLRTRFRFWIRGGNAKK